MHTVGGGGMKRFFYFTFYLKRIIFYCLLFVGSVGDDDEMVAELCANRTLQLIQGRIEGDFVKFRDHGAFVELAQATAFRSTRTSRICRGFFRETV